MTCATAVSCKAIITQPFFWKMKIASCATKLATLVSMAESLQQWPILEQSGNGPHVAHCHTAVSNLLCADAPSYSLCFQAKYAKCQKLQAQFPSQVALPEEETYRTELSQYWSLQQSQTQPACIFYPRSAQDVASAVRVAIETSCPFAVKSGGHVPFAGASNIAGGITINLSKLNEININKDENTVSVGPGNKWRDVYRQLEKEQITVVGGRIADVGGWRLNTRGWHLILQQYARVGMRQHCVVPNCNSRWQNSHCVRNIPSRFILGPSWWSEQFRHCNQVCDAILSTRTKLDVDGQDTSSWGPKF